MTLSSLPTSSFNIHGHDNSYSERISTLKSLHGDVDLRRQQYRHGPDRVLVCELERHSHGSRAATLQLPRRRRDHYGDEVLRKVSGDILTTERKINFWLLNFDRFFFFFWGKRSMATIPFMRKFVRLRRMRPTKNFADASQVVSLYAAVGTTVHWFRLRTYLPILPADFTDRTSTLFRILTVSYILPDLMRCPSIGK